MTRIALAFHSHLFCPNVKTFEIFVLNIPITSMSTKDIYGSVDYTEVEETAMFCMEKLAQSPQFLDAVAESVAGIVMERFEERIESITDQITTLKYVSFTKEKLIQHASDRLDNLEQISRLKNLKITGVAENEVENTDGIVVSLFKRYLFLDLPMDAIDRSFRLGIARMGRSRPIIVRFVRYCDRDRVYMKKSMLKGTGIVVREDLCKSNQSLYNSAVSNFDHHNVWTHDGHIYIKTNDGVIIVKNNADIENLKATYK